MMRTACLAIAVLLPLGIPMQERTNPRPAPAQTISISMSRWASVLRLSPKRYPTMSTQD